MTQQTQWVAVTAEGAEQLPGFRCGGCGQVKWQAEPPTQPCDICPAPVVDRDPAPSPTIEEPPSVTAALKDLLPPKPAEERRPRSRIPGLTKLQEDE